MAPPDVADDEQPQFGKIREEGRRKKKARGMMMQRFLSFDLVGRLFDMAFLKVNIGMTWKSKLFFLSLDSTGAFNLAYITFYPKARSERGGPRASTRPRRGRVDRAVLKGFGENSRHNDFQYWTC